MHVWCCCIHVLEVCAQSYFSWGALLYRFDDGDPVSLFQGKAIASITGPYLGKQHVSHQQNPKPADIFTEDNCTHSLNTSRYCYRQIATMLVFAHASENNAY